MIKLQGRRDDPPPPPQKVAVWKHVKIPINIPYYIEFSVSLLL